MNWIIKLIILVKATTSWRKARPSRLNILIQTWDLFAKRNGGLYVIIVRSPEQVKYEETRRASDGSQQLRTLYRGSLQMMQFACNRASTSLEGSGDLSEGWSQPVDLQGASIWLKKRIEANMNVWPALLTKIPSKIPGWFTAAHHDVLQRSIKITLDWPHVSPISYLTTLCPRVRFS